MAEANATTKADASEANAQQQQQLMQPQKADGGSQRSSRRSAMQQNSGRSQTANDASTKQMQLNQTR
jgi:hypothetical protein